jgi:hypothetical protein
LIFVMDTSVEDTACIGVAKNARDVFHVRCLGTVSRRYRTFRASDTATAG